MKLLSTLGTTAFLALAALPASSAVITLNFEGIGDLNPVGNFYDGGAGTNFGVGFSSNALAVVDADAGGSGNIGGEPSPSTALFFLDGPAATMNVAAGFTTGFSFFYSAVNNSGFINVWDGLNATGTLLASLFLPVTPSDGGDPNGSFSPFYAIGVAFAGTAMSVDFGGTVNQIAFDNVTFGSVKPGGPSVPLPASALFGLLGVASLLGMRKARKV